MKNRHGSGLHLDKAGWVDLARSALQTTIAQQLAMPHAELEARLWEHGWYYPQAQRRLRFYPHILTEATTQLLYDSKLQLVDHPTKGDATVPLYVTGYTARRQTSIGQARRRKGMLYARYLRWSDSFGSAGEQVVNHSLTEAMRQGVGYSPIADRSPFGEVKRIADLKFSGAVDSGAWLLVRDPRTGLPLKHHLVLIEVKNRRQTLYPRHRETHQVLYKAALAAEEFADQPITPILICRYGHPWLYWMAKDLGFLALGARRQFLTLPPKTSPKHLEEVKAELTLSDLTPINGERMPRIIEFFERTLPEQAAAAASRWQLTAPVVRDWAEQLRKDTHSVYERSRLVKELYAEVYALFQAHDLGEPRSWAVFPEEDDD